ncbi:MAG: hypothetical protein ACYC5M_10390 [Anaerolineae bacterium]
MTRRLHLILVLVVALALAACSKSATATTLSTGAAAAEGEGNTLPVLTQLLIGTFQLEDTDQAVNAEQAAELLPLWKAYRSLSQNTSSSQAELEALVQQIRDAMRPTQLAQIEALELGREDLMALMEERGIEARAAGEASGADSQATTRRTQGGMALGGGGGGGVMIQGGPPAGVMGVMPEGAQAMSAEQIATLSAQRSAGGGGYGVPNALYVALIELLESRAQAG